MLRRKTKKNHSLHVFPGVNKWYSIDHFLGQLEAWESRPPHFSRQKPRNITRSPRDRRKKNQTGHEQRGWSFQGIPDSQGRPLVHNQINSLFLFFVLDTYMSVCSSRRSLGGCRLWSLPPIRMNRPYFTLNTLGKKTCTTRKIVFA